MRRRVIVIVFFIGFAILGAVVTVWNRGQLQSFVAHEKGFSTVEDRLADYGPSVRARLKPLFAQAHIAYPPQHVALVGLKQERQLQVYAAGTDNQYRNICTYSIQAASGHLGPKLREGDYQVPEGVYAIESLNPNSKFHLALRVGYPNHFDQEQAIRDGRTDLGGDIMIHGGAKSAGCLAMGDAAAEDLFVLAADTGKEHCKIIISPVDFRQAALPEHASHLQPAWVFGLYRALQVELNQLPLQGSRKA